MRILDAWVACSALNLFLTWSGMYDVTFSFVRGKGGSIGISPHPVHGLGAFGTWLLELAVAGAAFLAGLSSRLVLRQATLFRNVHRTVPVASEGGTMVPAAGLCPLDLNTGCFAAFFTLWFSVIALFLYSFSEELASTIVIGVGLIWLWISRRRYLEVTSAFEVRRHTALLGLHWWDSEAIGPVRGLTLVYDGPRKGASYKLCMVTDTSATFSPFELAESMLYQARALAQRCADRLGIPVLLPAKGFVPESELDSFIALCRLPEPDGPLPALQVALKPPVD